MNKNNKTIPINTSGNAAKIQTLEFEEADAYMLARALSVAVVTAMTCSGEESIGRLRYYKEKLMELAPPGAKLFDRDTHISEIAFLSTTAPNWSIHRIRQTSYASSFRVVVTVGDRRFGSSGLLDTEDDFRLMEEAVRHLVDMNCQQVVVEDIVGNVWGL